MKSPIETPRGRFRSNGTEPARRGWNPVAGSAFRLVLLALSGGALAAACRGDESPPPIAGYESDFLSQCIEGCSAGLDCIGGLCTKPCVADEPSACATFPTAECRADGIAAGDVAVCDVPCDSTSPCGALGSGYVCQGGFCRYPELVLSAGALNGGESPDAGSVDCEMYRDQPGKTEMTLTIRNERSTPLYVLPFRECDDPTSSLVSLERDGQSVNVRGFGTCGNRTCEDIQENGASEALACPAACQPQPTLVRIEPGAELEGGRLWREFVSHGISSTSERMPAACSAGYSDPASLPGEQCFAQRPLPAGTYRATARAFTSVECCDCSPGPSGTCTTSAAGGVGNPVLATTTFDVPTATAVLTFLP